MLHVNLQKLHCTLFNQKEQIPQRPHTGKCWDVLTGKIIICIIIIIFFVIFPHQCPNKQKSWYTRVAETWPKGQNLFYYKNEIKKLPPISRYWFSNSLIWSSFFTKSLSPHDKQIVKVIDHFFFLCLQLPSRLTHNICLTALCTRNNWRNSHFNFRYC